jgi:hypothetical protein
MATLDAGKINTVESTCYSWEKKFKVWGERRGKCKETLHFDGAPPVRRAGPGLYGVCKETLQL